MTKILCVEDDDDSVYMLKMRLGFFSTDLKS